MQKKMARKVVTARFFYLLLAVTWVGGISSFIYFENNIKNLINIESNIFEMNMDNFDFDSIFESDDDGSDDADVSYDNDYADGYSANGIGYDGSFEDKKFILSKQVFYECVEGNKHSLGYRNS